MRICTFITTWSIVLLKADRNNSFVFESVDWFTTNQSCHTIKWCQEAGKAAVGVKNTPTPAVAETNDLRAASTAGTGCE